MGLFQYLFCLLENKNIYQAAFRNQQSISLVFIKKALIVFPLRI